MNEQEKKDIAYDVGSFWLENCTDDEFYKICIDDICNKIGHISGPIPNLAYEIWEIIEREVI